MRSSAPSPHGWAGAGWCLADQRRQGTGKTPAGTFAITSAFGRLPDPGTSLPYRQFDRNDAWTYNPEHPFTYNVFQTSAIGWRSYGGYAEHLWPRGRSTATWPFSTTTCRLVRSARQGRHPAHDPAANTKAGGGIFLHVSKGKSTAGCISVPLATMRGILAWLEPERSR